MTGHVNFRSLLLTWVLGLVIALAINCASAPRVVHRVGDTIYEGMFTATNVANNMVSSGQMTREQRQEFAKEVTVPILTILDEAIFATLAWSTGDPIPVAVSNLINQLVKGIDRVRTVFGADSDLHKVLLSVRAEVDKLLGRFQ